MANTAPTQFPIGWDERRVQRTILHYENQSDGDAIAEDVGPNWVGAAGKEGVHMMMDEFAQIVLNTLETMDAEADSVDDRGVRRGLVNYAAHFGSQLERSWSRGVAEHLTRLGYPSETERQYPVTREKCDVVTRMPDGSLFWIELKPAWRVWFSDSGSVKRNPDEDNYRGFLFYPLEGRKLRPHSASLDIDKLASLTRPHAAHVGLVLLGFDETGGEIENDVESLFNRKGLRGRGWEKFGPRRIPDRNEPTCAVYAWFLWREAPAEEASEPTDRAEQGGSPPAGSVIGPVRASLRQEDLRSTAASVFRRYMADERKTGREWPWESAIAVTLDLPRDSPEVARLGKQLRSLEKPYRVTNYDDPDRWERLLDRFEDLASDFPP